MDINKIKQYIYNNEKVQYVLEQINCHSIVKHSNYYTCGNYDGDNKKAINVYFDNEYLCCKNHTRDIRLNKNNDNTSLIDLVCFNRKENLFQSVKFLCDILGLDYYKIENEDDIPESLKITEMLYSMSKGSYSEEDNTPINPINEKILKYYKPYVNDLFYNDGIDYDTQKEFEIGYDDETNHITIPIRDELNNLVGVKGRVFSYDKDIENKYIYLERCPKSKVLYGLNKSIGFIRKDNMCYVFEAEKAVMQCFSYGLYNCVSVSGHKISKYQKNKLIGLGVDITICYDKDVSLNEILDECKMLKDNGADNVYYMYDKDNLLGDKESPTDNHEKLEQLLKNNIYKYE